MTIELRLYLITQLELTQPCQPVCLLVDLSVNLSILVVRANLVTKAVRPPPKPQIGSPVN